MLYMLYKYMIHVEFKKHDRTYVLTIPLNTNRELYSYVLTIPLNTNRELYSYVLTIPLNTNRELYRMILCFHLIPIESCIE